MIDILISNIHGHKIAENLRSFTTLPHLAGTRANAKVAEKISKLWKANGLEDVHYVKYDVLLSYPDYDNPNHLHIFDKNDKIVYTTKSVSPPLIPKEQSAKGAGIRWLAYSANGTIRGQVVYCHFGRKEDFERLKYYNIDPKGKIAMIRYGKIFRGDKIWNAQLAGAIGAILFSDPFEIARDGTEKENVYPNSEWLPNVGVQRGSIMHGKGDPLSPLYPSKKDLYRSKTIKEAMNDYVLPKIPALPISYSDAYQVLSYMRGYLAPFDWHGGLNVTYYLGPEMKENNEIQITVHSTLENRTIRNVIGYIRGTTDPDKYVILGNHYDAWVYGALDPNSATAILAEVARGIVQTMKITRWRPGRTIVFCNWDAEEYGLIGSTEFVEEYANLLNQRAIAYFNVDNIHSNYSLHVNTVPTLYQFMAKISKLIPNPMKSEEKHGRKTLYDTWFKTFPSNITFLPDIPSMLIPRGQSDHAPFLNYLGIPVADITYRNKTSYDNYPLYHSLYETSFTNEHIIDTNNLAVHEAVGKYWAAIVCKFADLPVLPINITDLALSIVYIYIPPIKQSLDKLIYYEDILYDAKYQFNCLFNTSMEFLENTRRFDNIIQYTLLNHFTDFYDLRHFSWINDRLMGVERCFINPRGIPDEPSKRHLLFSVSSKNKHRFITLSIVHDAIDAFNKAGSDAERVMHARQIAFQISVIQHAIQCAISMLNDRI
ncbi:N-acetylated-alpha-linked acidic dipeptidase 2 [Loa loa]|nr:N-acetylated-alpha-linked acidic dipeptidase 2 [Loa loa]EJD74024.1 N-acetylated-alpha-linked acidic dipeptidase 2 [Loa loa]